MSTTHTPPLANDEQFLVFKLQNGSGLFRGISAMPSIAESFPLLSDWLQELGCQNTHRHWGENIPGMSPRVCSTLHAQWTEAGRPALKWPLFLHQDEECLQAEIVCPSLIGGTPSPVHQVPQPDL